MGKSREPIETLSTERLDAEIGELAAHINAATCRWLELVAEFDRRDAHEGWGFQHCSSWLSWRCSLAPRAAREHVRVANALVALPLVRASFARGELSYSKVRALTRIASERNEPEVVELGLHATAAQLERVTRSYLRAQSIEQANESHARRHLAYHWDDDGTLSFRGRLSAEDGALFLRAIEAGREAAYALPAAEGGSAEPPAENPRQASNADALVAMAEACLASGEARRSGADRNQVVIHLDADGAHLDDGPSIVAEAARRLCCDASFTPIAERAGEPLSVGRKTRAIPPAVRRALHARDGGCRYPGCTNRRFTDAHHIRHWADGGETSLKNLTELCRRHHRLVHEGGFRIERREANRLVFRRPDGRPIPACPTAPRSHPERVRAISDRRSLRIDADTCFPRSAGDRIDLDLTIWGLCRLDEAAGPVDTRAGPDW